MVKAILDKLNIKNREARFVKPPDTTYAVWFDSFNSRGADNINLLKEHSYMIELYEYAPDPQTEKLIEDELERMGIEYDKQDINWIENEQLYQVIYEFEAIEKGGK